jgi:hypothetical protein
MDDDQAVEFGTFLMELAAYWRTPLSPIQCELYFGALRDLELSEIRKAATTIIRKGGSGFMPRADELRAVAESALPAEQRAGIAWTQVNAAVSAHGYTSSVDFEDRCINAAIRSMGGWEQLCLADASWFREFAPNQFKKAYIGFAENGMPDEMAAPLPGHRFDVMPEVKRIAAMDRLQLPASQRNAPEALAAPVSQTSAREMLARIAEHTTGKAAEFIYRVTKGGPKP